MFALIIVFFSKIAIDWVTEIHWLNFYQWDMKSKWVTWKPLFFFSRVAGGVRHGKCSTIGSHGHRMDCGKDVEAEPRSIGDGPPFFQWEFQDPKMEVPTIYKAYVRPM